MTSAVGVEGGGCVTTATGSVVLHRGSLRTLYWIADYGRNLKMGEATVEDRGLEDKEEESIPVVLQWTSQWV